MTALPDLPDLPGHTDADTEGDGEGVEGAVPGGPDPSGSPALSGQEEELRRLLRDAVGGIEPTSGALDHLQDAVPARRRRRRHLLIGTAASVALLGLGAPLVLSAAASVGGGGENSLDAGADHSVDGSQRGTADGGSLGIHPSDGRPTGGAEDYPDGTAGPGRPPGGVYDGQFLPNSPHSDETLGASSPTCRRGQLGEVTTDLEPPDEQGRIYGLIRLANVSDTACLVTGNGELAALPFGTEGAADIQIVDRTEGDRATGLPTPDETHEELIVPAGEAYEVRFAWVPSASAAGTCEVEKADDEDRPADDPPTSTADPMSADVQNAPSSAPGENGGANGDGANGGGAGGGGTEGPPSGSDGDGSSDGPGTTAGTGDPGEEEPSDDPSTGDPSDPPSDEEEDDDGVVLRYTPAAGEPAAAQIRLEGDCSGTIYRTGVLEAPGP
ncbi:hypothetical protein [Streptomyces sp. SBT349]|uniref:hypothetical protein n=1 Tax=Streptomyces sp. SBT349 TaxID=1580539 RepID=UPI00066E95D6|nr:hypothetical protein [Streptomyces sp. SBT349]